MSVLWLLVNPATRKSKMLFANITSTKVKPLHLKAIFAKRFLHLLLGYVKLALSSFHAMIVNLHDNIPIFPT